MKTTEKKVYAGDRFKINSHDGEEVTVLYVEGENCLLLRDTGNLIKANGFHTEGDLIFWNHGGYRDNDLFENLMKLM